MNLFAEERNPNGCPLICLFEGSVSIGERRFVGRKDYNQWQERLVLSSDVVCLAGNQELVHDRKHPREVSLRDKA